MARYFDTPVLSELTVAEEEALLEEDIPPPILKRQNHIRISAPPLRPQRAGKHLIFIFLDCIFFILYLTIL